MYFLEHPTKGILMEPPDEHKPKGTWSWSKPRPEAHMFHSLARANYVLSTLPGAIANKVTIMMGLYPYTKVWGTSDD